MSKQELLKVRCPYCGYRMPIEYIKGITKCEKIYAFCKGRGCKKKFEIKIE